jgi:hypothetical protein
MSILVERPMKRLLLSFVLVAALVTIGSRDVHADAPPARTVYALIVTSNHGVSGAQPDLHYADDDGVKYLELFRMLAPEENVILHTELDRDTERLYPRARSAARPPTKAAISATIADLVQRVKAVTQVGGIADFYFVFAGHGDVDAGVGFLELGDARFTSGDMESMLRSIAATRSHVILDSCNSFFVMSARKPGGRPIATTADEARSLSERLPSVGVFLSTSSEAEVFEWSELQAGIFSHVVRSGLTGAADANGDGDVSYEELRTFVSVASARIKNPLYRPKVFARGPDANGGAPLVRLSTAHAAALRIDGPQIRLTVRDADDVPLVDLHKEDGATVLVRLPERWTSHAAAEERDTQAQSHVLKRFVLEAPHSEQPIALAQLPPASPVGEARGTSDVFRALFAVPFGPKALANAVEDVRKEDASAVFGVSEDEVFRLRTLLAQAAGVGQGGRFSGGAGDLTFGAVLGSAGGWLLTRNGGATTIGPSVLLTYGALQMGSGVWLLLSTTAEEDLFRWYSRAIQSTDPSQRAAAVLDAERRLFELRRRAHKSRMWSRGTSFALAGLSVALFALNEFVATRTYSTCFGTASNLSCTSTPRVSSDSLWAGRLTFGSAFALGVTGVVSSFNPYSVERFADIWESDPGRVRGQDARPNVALAPVRGGAQLQLGWSF